MKDLELPERIKEFYLAAGIRELYPPQAEALEKGLLAGENLVAAIPTASGKTLLAELAMLKSIHQGGKALYIVPLRALASEKYDHFQRLPGVRVTVATGDYDRRDDLLGRNDIIVVTSEKADSLLRNGAGWMEELTVVVADEIHLLNSPDRGPTLEVTLARLRQLNPNAQFLALSATIGNPEEIATWLDAQLVTSTWRPVELREGIYYQDQIFFTGNKTGFTTALEAQRQKTKVTRHHRDDLISLVLDTVEAGGQCLVFEGSRKNAEASARRISQALTQLLGENEKKELEDIASEIEEGDTETARQLARCIRGGAAFHHAGLLPEHRKIVETSFRDNLLKSVSSTPTLAAGLNLPARRVIIRGYRRYNANEGMVYIPVLEYKQMAGRAGRPGLDTTGEAIMIARSKEEMEELQQKFIHAKPEKIYSKLGAEPSLRSHLLSLIAGDVTRTKTELQNFLTSTFYATQQPPDNLKETITRILELLEEKNMIQTKNSHLYPTPLGSLTSRLYLDPLTASNIIEDLKSRRDVTHLTLLHIIARTPNATRLYLRARDYNWLEDFIDHHQDELMPLQGDYEWHLTEVKTAALLYAWITEETEDNITGRFNIGPGDLRAQTETAKWLIHSLTRISQQQKLGVENKAQDLETRLSYGVKKEILELVKLKDIGRIRARKLYQAGYKTPQDLLKGDSQEISRLIGTRTAEKVLRRLGKPRQQTTLDSSL